MEDYGPTISLLASGTFVNDLRLVSRFRITIINFISIFQHIFIYWFSMWRITITELIAFYFIWRQTDTT
ncbi:unnamed protein product [Acanthoscelides obtectus]|uniref:Uncharacterized protein n=1 Tax=Acanthoscelides obtectus TaxID=200917 RepID=A0A9P0LH08_ACAOB|nr:unnamed protein product [Acanthoscelides obtectus]CAK1657195.1 hypothetical protein AOBTE_LOCUS20194 [Acanthoscelides obtectus]